MNTVFVRGRVHLQHVTCLCLPMLSKLGPWSYIGHREAWARYIEC